jgi:hypothetical protein
MDNAYQYIYVDLYKQILYSIICLINQAQPQKHAALSLVRERERDRIGGGRCMRLADITGETHTPHLHHLSQQQQRHLFGMGTWTSKLLSVALKLLSPTNIWGCR